MPGAVPEAPPEVLLGLEAGLSVIKESPSCEAPLDVACGSAGPLTKLLGVGTASSEREGRLKPNLTRSASEGRSCWLNKATGFVFSSFLAR